MDYNHFAYTIRRRVDCTIAPQLRLSRCDFRGRSKQTRRIVECSGYREIWMISAIGLTAFLFQLHQQKLDPTAVL
jgi:hypothetical protein